jgi:acetyl esterase/lipase
VDIERVAPELRDATLKLPRMDASKAFLRRAMRVGTVVMPVPKAPGVTVTTTKAGRTRARAYRPPAPTSASTSAPTSRLGVLWVHGGGFLIGNARHEALCAGTAARLGITVVSANYPVVRGAPHGFENWARSTAPAGRLIEHAQDWLRSLAVPV